MISEIRSTIQKKFSSTRKQIIIILLFPAILLIAFGLSNNAYHIKNYESLIVSNYTNELNSFLRDTEDKMNSTVTSARFISTNPDISSVLTATEKPTQQQATPTISTLKQSTKFVDIIDSISIYNRTANFVISSNGLYDADTYFDMIYKYENYNFSYWYDYHSIAGDMKILSATTLKNDTSTETKTIVPLVFTSLGNIASGNLVIYNININTLFEHFEIYRLTPNTKIYMKDNTAGTIHADSFDTEADAINYTFIQAIKRSLQSNTDMVRSNGEKHLLIQSTARSNSWGYSYFVTIPYSDIHNTATKIFFVSSIFILILFIGLILFVILGSKSLYVPWKKLASTANSVDLFTDKTTHGTSDDIADYVTNTILDISTANKTLRQNLDATLPLSQEKYLIDVLNNNINIESADNIPEPLSFKYDYFIAISIRITINPAFFSEDPSIPSFSVIQKRLHKVLQSIFSNKFTTYELPSTNDILYLLLNVENDLYTEEINTTIEEIKMLFKNDNENLDIIFGIGSIYKGFDGLRLTHQEALSNMIKALNSGKIQFSIQKNNGYIFTQSSESILINYLTAGLIDKAKEFLKNIFDNIITEPSNSKKQIYSDIVIVLRKVIRQKNMTSAEISADQILELLQNKTSVSDENIQSQIFILSDSITEYMQANSKKVNIEEIIKYINEHYTENPFLDEIAQKYNTTTKYLSKRIKQYLNVPFKEYITQLKINKAKELLSQTDITVSELYSKVGFQDRGAFTRAFKLKTGMTPSEYKKHHKNI